MKKANKLWTEDEIENMLKIIKECNREYNYNNHKREGIDWNKVAKKVNGSFGNNRTGLGCRVKCTTEKKKQEKQRRLRK